MGWDARIGAQVQWGLDHTEMYFNDLDPVSWTPHAIKMNPLTGATKQLDGPVYMVSPDGALAASPSLVRTGLTQAGCGVIVPTSTVPRNVGAPSDDGIFITDTNTGKCELLVSLEEIVDQAIPPLDPAANACSSSCAGSRVTPRGSARHSAATPQVEDLRCSCQSGRAHHSSCTRL